MYAIIGIALIAFATGTGFFLERRQFLRRNVAGIQEFKSYGNMVKKRLEEGTMKAGAVIAAFVGIGFIVAQFR